MSSTIEHRLQDRPSLAGDAQLQLIRRYARMLRSAPAATRMAARATSSDTKVRSALAHGHRSAAPRP